MRIRRALQWGLLAVLPCAWSASALAHDTDQRSKAQRKAVKKAYQRAQPGTEEQQTGRKDPSAGAGTADGETRAEKTGRVVPGEGEPKK